MSEQDQPTARTGASEKWLVAQATLMIAVTAWAKAGRAEWAPLAELSLGACGLIPLFLSYLEHRRAKRRDKDARFSLKAFSPFALYALMVGASLLNLSHLPLPEGGWQEIDGWEDWLPVTMDFQLTVSGSQAWLLALFEAGLIGTVLRTRRTARHLALALVLVGLSLALIGAFFWFSGSQLMLGFLEVPGGQFFASFVYKNHWAAYAILLACLSAGLGFSEWSKGDDDREAKARRLFYFSAMFMILITIPLPVSRSGMVMAGGVMLAVFLTALGRIANNRGKSRAWRFKALGVISVLVAVSVGRVLVMSWPSIETGWNRSEKEYRDTRDAGRWNLRVYSARDTFAMAADRPLFGWGAGTFGAVFPLYQGDYLRDKDGTIVAKHLDAHCDWAQVPAENGYVGLLVLAGSALLAWRTGWKKGSEWRRWTLGGLALIAVYAVAEFPFQNPAVLLLWCALLALCASAPRRPARRPSYAEATEAR